MIQGLRLTDLPYHERLADRFWPKADRGEGCWEWRGYRKRGYGYVVIARKPRLREVRAHRIAYVLSYGDIPDGMLVCHHCDNPSCVRPDHLFLGTYADNHADMDQKGRRGHGRVYGEAHGRSKLSCAKAAEIRRLTEAGRSHRQLAVQFGVSPTAIRLVQSGRTWKHDVAVCTQCWHSEEI